jgi:hypothetical protein
LRLGTTDAIGADHGGDGDGISCRHFEIDSELGHAASTPEHAKWSPVLREVLESLIAERS